MGLQQTVGEKPLKEHPYLKRPTIVHIHWNKAEQKKRGMQMSDQHHHGEGETYFAIESSKGELGVYLISDGSEYPWRAKIRGPSFVNLQVLPELLRGYKMSDVIAVLGSLDFVVGEVDR